MFWHCYNITKIKIFRLFTLPFFLFLLFSQCGSGKVEKFQKRMESRLQYKEFYKDFIGNIFGYAAYIDKAILKEIETLYCEKKLCSKKELAKKLNKIINLKQSVFFISVYTKNPKWNNLDSVERSVFKVALMSAGRVIKPLKIESASRYAFLFPVDTAFFKSYFVYFPEIKSGTSVKLVIGGIPGKIEFLWKKIP